MARYYFLCLLAGLATACQSPNTSNSDPQAAQLWLNAGTMVMVGKDTIFQRMPMLLDLQPDGTAEWARVSVNGKAGKVEWLHSTGKWWLADKKLHFEYTMPQDNSGNLRKEAWDLVALSGQQLLVSDPARRGTYQMHYVPADSMVSVQTLRQFWTNGARYRFEMPARSNNAPFLQDTAQLTNNRFSFPRHAFTVAKPLFGEVVEWKGRGFLMLDYLSGLLDAWDLVQVQSVEGNTLRGLFYYKNKQQTITIHKVG